MSRVLRVTLFERTNNPAEHFFSQTKHRLHRRLGHANLGWDMQDQPAQAAWAANLLDPSYVEIVCVTLESLPEAFAEVNESPERASQCALDRGTKHSDPWCRSRQWETAQSPRVNPSETGASQP